MYRLPLGNLMIRLGEPTSAAPYRWKCGCSARRDKKCVNDQLYWRMCTEHSNKE